jgi:tRNA pseudouridine55 synthase
MASCYPARFTGGNGAMARKGRDIHGWAIVDKPVGVTSTQVVGKVRWAAGARKAGHAGTLDPLADGVLAVALGEATKTVPYLMAARKAYRFTVRWGVVTTTDDREGAVVGTCDARPETTAITAALAAFTGEIMQVPPTYSAVKVDGARAYDLARAGAAPELKARPLTVHELHLTDRPDADHATFEMVCGKGGYVRSIARDLGEALGCGAHVAALRRLWSGPFHEREAIPFAKLEELAYAGGFETHLTPVATGLADIPALAVAASEAAALRQGRPVAVAVDAPPEGAEVWASHAGAPVAIGAVRDGVFRPRRVFTL